MAGCAIFTTQYLQLVLGMAPLTAALWSVAPAVVVGAAAPTAAALAQAGVRKPYLVAGGFLIAAAGLAVLSRIGPDSGLWVIMVGAGVLSAGLVVVMSLATELLMGTTSAERAGATSAVLETGSEFGGALGIAVLGSIGAAVYRDRLASLDASAGPAARETLAGALATAGHLPARAGDALVEAARTAFTSGLNVVAVVAGLVMLAGAGLALLALPRAAPPQAQAQSRAEPETPRRTEPATVGAGES
jgi:DHA2 family multidrug resistance protein-like MFS transporter